MKRLTIAAGLLLALTLLPGVASAQTGTARGRVVDEQGQVVPEAKVLVEFKAKDLTAKFETKTNKKGEYIQVGLRPGVYRVTASKDGYQGSYAENRISLGEATVMPDILLRKAAAAAGAAGGGADELRAHFKKALELTQSGQLDQAEAAYKEILTKAPSIPEVHYNLGYLYTQKKDWAAAEAAFQKALELKPDYSEATVALAKVYQDSGQVDKAAELMNKTSEGSSDPKVLFNAAIFHLNSGQSQEAMDDFLKAEASDPQNAEIQYHLGTIMVGQNKIADAVARLEKYLSMNPQNPQNVATAKGLLAALKPKK
jgi:tetratricopeptide (TPR) repeat protein